MNRKNKTFIFNLIYNAILILLMIGLVKAYDIYIQRTAPAQSADLVYDKPSIRDGFIYPYTGSHIGAGAHHEGPMPTENSTEYQDFDVRSGDHGFFVDFDLENPPPKKENEVRVILIGGSSGQGFGARTNDDMIYRVLERLLNERLGDDGISVSVINLAMAGSHTYQNYIALNLWGRRLEPDYIVTFAGGNDVSVTQAMGSNMWASGYYIYCELWLPAEDERPARFNRLSRAFPGLMLHTNLGFKVIGSAPEAPEWNNYCRERYARNTNVAGLYNRRDEHERLLRTDMPDAAELRARYKGPDVFREKIVGKTDPEGRPAVLEEISAPLYIHAVKSIKRDFLGIPILVAFQPIDWRFYFPMIEEEYQELFINRARRELENYYNDKWLFVDINRYW